MSKRAAIIITDALNVVCTTRDSGYSIDYWEIETSERLLADLRVLVKLPGPSQMGWVEAQQAAARVRALLPKEGEDE